MTSPLPPLPDGASARMERDLFARVSQHSTRVKRIRNVGIIGAAAVVVGGTVAGVTLANPFQQSNSAYCYQSASTSSRYSEVSAAPDGQSSSGQKLTVTAPTDRASTALANCAAVWRAGILVDTGSATSTTTSDLVVCIRPDQVLAVFPSGSGTSDPPQFCHALGLDPVGGTV